MNFSDVVKQNTDEKYAKLASGKAERSTTDLEIASCDEYKQKREALQKRLNKEEVAVFEALKDAQAAKKAEDAAAEESRRREEAERAEAERRKKEEEKREAARKEAERKAAEKAEAERLRKEEAERKEAEARRKHEIEMAELAARKAEAEAKQREELRLEAERKEAEKAEAERLRKEEAERKAAEQKRKEEEEALRAAKAAQDKKKRTIRNIIIGAVALVAIVVTIIIIASVSKSNEYKRYSADNIVLSIVDRCEPTESSSYYDGYVIAFDMNIKNNSVLDIVQIRGELVVYNAGGKKLLTADCIFSSLNIGAGKEVNTVLNIDCRENADVLELYYSDCDDLSATFKLTEVLYKGADGREYDEEPVSVLALKDGSDGVSSTEKSYQEALAMFNQGKYTEAAPLFEALGSYKDSYNYYSQCCSYIEIATYDAIYNKAMDLYAQEKYGEAINTFNEIYGHKDSAEKIDEIILVVETKAESYACVGDYAEACNILEQLGYNSNNSNLYQAYAYANEGYFADAVQCGLTVVVISEGVETIPDNYFKDANHNYSLKKVVLPSTIKSIGTSAFYGCSKLTEINLPLGMVAINPSAFSGCTSLTAIAFPEGLTTIGNNAFAYCSNLKQVQWSSTILTIGNNAFKSCDSITSLDLPSKITSIGTGAFTECDGLLTVSIPGSIKTISESAFSSCTRLTQVTMNSGTEVIGAYAFSNCPMLSNLTLADTLKEIRNNAFYQCTALTEVTIPAQVTLIGNYAFCGCSSLQRVYFDNTEGWVKNGWSDLTVTDAQKNAQKLVVGADTWSKS